MAFYADEEEVYKCPKHPSKRRRTCGVCPSCLTDRLSALCPDCAHVRPCPCCATSSSSPLSISSSSSSLSLSSSSDAPRVGSLIAAEPAFRRSRSVAAVPFLRSRFAAAPPPEHHRTKPKASFFMSFFKKEKDTLAAMTRSRSVVVTESATSAKGKGWYFPSPIKAFSRHNKTNKVVQERSPLYRG